MITHDIPTPYTLDIESTRLSTFAQLQIERREAVLMDSQRLLEQQMERFYALSQGDEGAEAVGRIGITDVDRATFRTEYQPLVEAGMLQAEPFTQEVMAVSSPKIIESEIERQQDAARQILQAQPFQRKIKEIAEALGGVVESDANIGTYDLGISFQEDDQLLQDVLVRAERFLSRNIDLVYEDNNISLRVNIRDQEPDEVSRYVHTESAKTLLSALDVAGLELNERARNEITRESDRRYGNAYAWMTRELTRQISNYSSSLLAGDSDVSRLEFTGDKGTDLLIDIMQQIFHRQDTDSDIPAASEHINLRDQGCKDVEVYFAQSADSPGKLVPVEVAGKQFWQKKYGGHTFLNLESVKYKGVELPPGCVFRKVESGFALLRITGFAFDKETAEQLFGAAMTKAQELPGDARAMSEVFRRFARERDQLVV